MAASVACWLAKADDAESVARSKTDLRMVPPHVAHGVVMNLGPSLPNGALISYLSSERADFQTSGTAGGGPENCPPAGTGQRCYHPVVTSCCVESSFAEFH